MNKQAWELRRQQWAAFHRWAAQQRPDPHPAGVSLEDIGAIFEWLPEAVRRTDPDPAKNGIRRMHEILGLLPGQE